MSSAEGRKISRSPGRQCGAWNRDIPSLCVLRGKDRYRAPGVGGQGQPGAKQGPSGPGCGSCRALCCVFAAGLDARSKNSRTTPRLGS